ncbi:MAG TPA: NHL repeat-containing protein, partial [Bacteroidota bacterium]|nr:NHL repeat-containing protein [Bacteroidota bacterium]
MKDAGSYFLGVLLLSVLCAAAAHSQWASGQNADLVLCQRDFVGLVSGTGPDSLSAPTDVAIDPLTRKLFVVDFANHRVLRWGRVDSLLSGRPAEAVLGQSTLESHTAGTAANQMQYPTAIAFDSAGRLWVADAVNNRVLRFDSAGFKPTGAPADGVLGQPNFTSNAGGLAQDSMNYVRGIAVDVAGHLWVSDQLNNRVLRFDNASSKPNGAMADGVLGQSDFTSSHDTLSRSSLYAPRGLVADSHGRLYVSDSFHDRVLRFDDAAAKPNGGEADGVLGEPDFDTDSGAVSRSGMLEPWGVELDASGRLYVSEFGGSRVTWFDSAYAKANGADADGVLGQPDFNTSDNLAAQNRLTTPWGTCIDPLKSTLWVADAGNNRILRFTASIPL